MFGWVLTSDRGELVLYDVCNGNMLVCVCVCV